MPAVHTVRSGAAACNRVKPWKLMIKLTRVMSLAPVRRINAMAWLADNPVATTGSKRITRASLSAGELPRTESLKETVARFLPYWHDTIAPAIKSGRRVLIAAHGNSLRALVKYLDNMSEQEIVELNIPTGIPLVYELDENLKPIRHYYLGDPEAAAAAAARVAAQSKAK